jgi:hypothetical protein
LQVNLTLIQLKWECLHFTTDELLIGSPEGVRENIHELHQRGYAEAGNWSGLLPAPNPGEVMSVLIRYRLVSMGALFEIPARGR